MICLKLKKPLHICYVLTILATLFKQSLSIDPKYKPCEPRNCGNGPNISYPFWISQLQESHCGLPKFEVTCHGKNPTLKISNEDYVIKKILYSNHSLLVSNAKLYNNEKCPVPRKNISLDETPFEFILNRVNLSFFYNCSTLPPDEIFQYPVECYGSQTLHSFAAFHGADFGSCQSIVRVPADIASGVEFDSLLRMNYTDILKMGFLLNWTGDSCTGCVASGSRCGVHGGQFTCGDGAIRDIRLKIKIGVGAGIGGIVLMCVLFFGYQWYKKKRYSILSRNISSDMSSLKDVEKSGSTCFGVHVFTYEELIEATNNFDSSKELGDGGFGTVYKGKLKDGRVVAVKRLYDNNFKRMEQFLNEIKILEQVRHHNLVSLYGCTSSNCRELLLVYEFVPNGTVSDHLHGSRSKPKGLPWATRLSIAIETACALTYLHHSDIIHRDVKTNNILLDKNFTVKVADFGLSRFFPNQATHVSTAPQGTPGYVDPDYHQCYQLTSKSDVFSFGVVLMELITAMPAVDITRHRHDINLSTMAINRIQNRTLHEIVDTNLMFGVDPVATKMITAVAELAFQCLQSEKDMRPSMKDVWEELKAIQTRDYGPEKTEKIIISADDAVLLENGLSLSPESVSVSWTSSSRNITPNASN